MIRIGAVAAVKFVTGATEAGQNNSDDFVDGRFCLCEFNLLGFHLGEF